MNLKKGDLVRIKGTNTTAEIDKIFYIVMNPIQRKIYQDNKKSVRTDGHVVRLLLHKSGIAKYYLPKDLKIIQRKY